MDNIFLKYFLPQRQNIFLFGQNFCSYGNIFCHMEMDECFINDFLDEKNQLKHFAKSKRVMTFLFG
jgi:hypothetical protein